MPMLSQGEISAGLKYKVLRWIYNICTRDNSLEGIQGHLACPVGLVILFKCVSGYRFPEAAAVAAGCLAAADGRSKIKVNKVTTR